MSRAAQGGSDDVVDEADTDTEIDAETKQTLTELAEELTAIDGPLYADDDAETVEQLIYGMFETIGGSRAAEIGEEPVVEAVGDDTNWRKYSEVPTYRAECGPFHVTESAADRDSATEAFVEIAPNGQRDGKVCIDANLRGEFEGATHEQGALHMLTPRQARSFAAALLEQAEYVGSLEGDR